MALLIRLLTFAILFSVFQPAYASKQTESPQQALENVKKLFDSGALAFNQNMDPQLTCIGHGYACRNSGECCGSAFCRSGVCNDSGARCNPHGAGCSNSGECCGSAFCRNGTCNDSSARCMPEHGPCSNSGECCGSSFCRDGTCQ